MGWDVQTQYLASPNHEAQGIVPLPADAGRILPPHPTQKNQLPKNPQSEAPREGG